MASYDEVTALVDKGRATDIIYLEMSRAFGTILQFLPGKN